MTLHMYVSDLGDRRAAEFVAPVASMGDMWRSGDARGTGHGAGSAKKFLRHFEDMLKRRDSSARREG